MISTGSPSANLTGLTALDLDGRPVELAGLAKAGPVVIAFLRHYG